MLQKKPPNTAEASRSIYRRLLLLVVGIDVYGVPHGPLALDALVSDNRWWVGYGFGGFWKTHAMASTAIPGLNPDYRPSDAHNGYMDVVLSFGVIGLLLVVITCAWAVRRSLGLLQRDYIKGIWVLAFMSFFLLANLAESYLTKSTNVHMWLFAYTVLLALRKRERKTAWV